jgi:nicotinamidase-related amidase
VLALLVVDMNHAFVDPLSPFRVAGALETVPRIGRVVAACRAQGFPVVFVTRGYRPDGSDVEVSRWRAWSQQGRPASLDSKGALSADWYEPLRPEGSDYVIVKKRWSAFFRTELDLLLRRRGVDTVAIVGTQTPNCIRATAFDADANDFAVVLLSDGTSSATPDVQAANLRDLANVGFEVIASEAFLAKLDHYRAPDPVQRAIRARWNVDHAPDP